MELHSTLPVTGIRSGLDYELFVRDVTNELLRLDGLSVAAEHHKALEGLSRQPHVVDVYWEYSLGGILHRVAIECKNLNRSVELGDVRNFGSVLTDIPGLRGIVVTGRGFGRGAKKYAKAHNIGLHIVRPPTDGDYGPRIKETLAVLTFPCVREIEFEINDEWLDANRGMRERLVAKPLTVTGDSTVDDRQNAMRTTLRSLIPRPTSNEIPVGNILLTYVDAYLDFPGIGPVKIDNLEVSYGFERIEHRVEFTYPSAKASVADVLADNAFVLDQRVRLAFSVKLSKSDL